MAKNIRRKVYLTFPAKKTKEALICEMYDRYQVRFNIRSASVTDDLGLIALEMDGPEDKMKLAFDFFRKNGLKVEPIEKSVIE